MLYVLHNSHLVIRPLTALPLVLLLHNVIVNIRPLSPLHVFCMRWLLLLSVSHVYDLSHVVVDEVLVVALVIDRTGQGVSERRRVFLDEIPVLQVLYTS